MLKIEAIVLAAVVSAVALPHQSPPLNPPVPSAVEQRQTPDGKTGKNQNSADQNLRGTKQRTPTSPVLPTVEAQKPAAEQSAEQYPETRHDWWIVVPGILLAAFTGLLFLYTAKLWSATKTLIGYEREHSARELRSYMGVTLSNPEGFQKGGSPKVVMTVKNYGQTPAYQGIIGIGCCVIPWPINWLRDIAYGDLTIVPYPVLEPDRSLEHPMPFDWTDVEREEVIKEKMAVCIYGEFRYQDVFKDWHVSRFCRVSYGEHAATGRFTYHAEGNVSN